MGSSSLFRVLAVGNNPNILLYTSRFQLAKSVELYHVSDSESRSFRVETTEYGKEEFQLDNHFTSVGHLIQAVKESGEHSSLIFDLIILSASSLQEISSLASQLNPLINLNTKLFLESSGFVQLEPFVKMSMDLTHLNIFSIFTDYDFRQVGVNEYKQFTHGATKATNTIYLGESSLAKQPQQQQQQQQQVSKGSPANSSSSLNTTVTKYPKNVITLLDTFQRLFQKLFPQDKVSLCNYSSTEFISQQWALAIPKICFEPLLIILEETNPAELHQQILAKPLISGLVTEVITVMKSMGAKLNCNLENESSLLSHWQKMYSQSDQIPSFLYHFIERTAPLNIDMLLLQPILLADDYGIKTPYLEFLYSLMCQYQKLNEGKSKWFTRIEDTQGLKSQLASITQDRNQLKTELIRLQKGLEEREVASRQLQSINQKSTNQIQLLQDQIGAMRQETTVLSKRYEIEIQHLKQEQRVGVSNGFHHGQNGNSGNDVHQDNSSPAKYGPAGTPNLKDIEDFAVFGVNYGDTPQKEQPKQHLQQPTPPPTSGSLHSSASGSGGSGSGNGSGPDADKWLKERELEIRKKELDLQERELEFQRRAVQQPRNSKGQKPMNFNNNATSPTLGNRRPSFPQLQQASNGRANRAMHGAAPGQLASAGNFMDPISSGIPYRNTSGFQPQPNSAVPLQPQQPQLQSHHSHSIKPTSRKNRNSNMAIIGNASSLGLSEYGRPPANSQTRLNSLSTGNLPTQSRVRQPSVGGLGNIGNNSNPRLNMPNPIKPNSFTIGNQPISAESNAQPQESQAQRQFSSSTGFDGTGVNPNISTNSVVHNPMTLHDGSVEQHNVGQGPTGAPSPPQIKLNGPESSPALSGSGFQLSDNNEESGDTNDEPHKENNIKEKKKKFGFFGKKKKSKK